MCLNEDYNTNRRKKKHLDESERNVIEVLWNTLDDKGNHVYSKSDISKIINVHRSVITREINRRSKTIYKQSVPHIVYKAEDAHRDYKFNRAKSVNIPILIKNPTLRVFIEKKIKEDKWSPDAIAGYLKNNPNKFAFDTKISTSTIYESIHNRILNISKLDTRRMASIKSRKKNKDTEQKESKLHKSIHLRPEIINDRSEFGHWEMDCVIGRKKGIHEVLLTITERQTRYDIIVKIERKTSISVVEAIDLMKYKFKENFSKIFKTITVDNGSEFSDWKSLEKDCNTFIYYADPYSSYQRGTNEVHNGMIRWFIPKGTPLEKYTTEDIKNISNWINNYPRKIFDYQTPTELIKIQLSKILEPNLIPNFFAL